MTRPGEIDLPKKTAVLMGGPSSEREVSLATGAGISKALRSLGMEKGEPFVLEVNTIPGMTEASLLPEAAAAAAGISYVGLCLQIIQLSGARMKVQ